MTRRRWSARKKKKLEAKLAADAKRKEEEAKKVREKKRELEQKAEQKKARRRSSNREEALGLPRSNKPRAETTAWTEVGGSSSSSAAGGSSSSYPYVGGGYAAAKAACRGSPMAATMDFSSRCRRRRALVAQLPVAVCTEEASRRRRPCRSRRGLHLPSLISSGSRAPSRSSAAARRPSSRLPLELWSRRQG